MPVTSALLLALFTGIGGYVLKDMKDVIFGKEK